VLTASIEVPVEAVSASIEMLRSPLTPGRVGTVGGAVQAPICAIAAHVQALLDAIPATVEVRLDAVPADIPARLARRAGLIGGCRACGEERYESQSHYSLSHGVLLYGIDENVQYQERRATRAR
jgi:hypothetical protein